MSGIFLPAADRFVCGRCIPNADLRGYIRRNATSTRCDFCGRTSTTKNIAADADAVIQLVADYVNDEYEDASEMVPYESREGGYQAKTLSTDELLLYEVGLEGANDGFLAAVADTLPDNAWVQKDFFSLHPLDELRSGWEGFAEAIKHETRYLFFPPKPATAFESSEGIRPEDMLAELGRVLRRSRRVRTIKAGTTIFRARIHGPNEAPSSLGELGPPPKQRAIYANRMSPAGISMLYGAETEATAVGEVTDLMPPGSGVTVGTIRLDAPFRVVDLVDLPPVKLFTGNYTKRERAQLVFAHRFADEVSIPVTRNGHEHIEYVPTQVVTEYLRYRFRSRGGPIDGIRYRSAKVGGGVNLALFVAHEQIVLPTWSMEKPAPLTLVSHRRVI